MSFSFIVKFLPSCVMKTFMPMQNPVNYAISKEISGDRFEKHVQGTIVFIRLYFIALYFLCPLLFLLGSPPLPLYNLWSYVMTEICIQKVNELSNHQLVWVDEDGFLLRPLGKNIFKHN